MEKKSDNFSMRQAMEFVNSPAGKQLLAALQQADPSVVQNAASAATNGDIAAARAALAPLLQSEEIAKLLGQLGG